MVTAGASTAAGAARKSGVDLGNADPEVIGAVAGTFAEVAKASGKALPTSMPSARAPAGYAPSQVQAARAAAKRRIKGKIARAAAKQRLRMQQLLAGQARKDGTPPPTTSGTGGKALPWLIGAGILAKVLL